MHCAFPKPWDGNHWELNTDHPLGFISNGERQGVHSPRQSTSIGSLCHSQTLPLVDIYCRSTLTMHIIMKCHEMSWSVLCTLYFVHKLPVRSFKWLWVNFDLHRWRSGDFQVDRSLQARGWSSAHKLPGTAWHGFFIAAMLPSGND